MDTNFKIDRVPLPAIIRKGRPQTPLGAFARTLKLGDSYLCKNKGEYETVRSVVERSLGLKVLRRIERDKETFEPIGLRIWVIKKETGDEKKRTKASHPRRTRKVAKKAAESA